MPDENTTVEIQKPGERKHPDYETKAALWSFLLASYKGGIAMRGRDGLTTTDVEGQTAPYNKLTPMLFKWDAEKASDYINRVMLTPYRNYARSIVNEFSFYVTKEEPKRKGVEKEGDFLANVDLKHTSMLCFVRKILTLQSVLGVMNILVDSPRIDGKQIETKRDELNNDIRPYCVPVLPHEMVDWSIGSDGKYEWVLIESERLVNDPFSTDDPGIRKRRTFWDKTQWQVYEEGENGEWGFIAGEPHNLGEVPVIRITHEDIDFDPETIETWFFDLADNNRYLYNMLSVMGQSLCKQTYGQVILPGDSGDDGKVEKKASTASAWTENPEESGISRYIQPDPGNLEALGNSIDDTKIEMYRISGLRHKTDSKAPESALAKAWDFEEVNQFLAALAKQASHIEMEIFRLKGKWEGSDNEAEVVYPTDFAIQELMDAVEFILGVKTAGGFAASETLRKESLKRLAGELKVSDEVKAVIDKEIDDSTEADPFENMSVNNGINETGGQDE